MDSTLFSTPTKRKLPDLLANSEDAAPSPSHTEFCFEVSPSALTDGSSSPRTKVAHKFRGLALGDGGGGVTAGDGPNGRSSDPATTRNMDVDDNEAAMRKRTKISPTTTAPFAVTALLQRTQPKTEIPETPAAPRSQPALAPKPTIEDLGSPTRDDLSQNSSNLPPLAAKPADATSSSSIPSNTLQEPYPSFNRPLESRDPRSRKRAGTPPLVASTTRAGNASQSSDEDAEIVDPVRTALTWHEDEITVYDPEDPNDDGEGINGIGFKPTAAIAHARTMKRRQQLAEYKKREERDARSRRSQRRRGSPEMTRLERKESARKVRFMEAEPTTMITT